MEAIMKDPILFGDYRAALSETEPRLYEELQDYEVAKALFQVQCSHTLQLELEASVKVL